MPRKKLFVLACAAILLAAGCAKKKPAAKAPAAPRPGMTETGIASWYGHPYHGRRAANGEIYDMEKMTAAHRTLPFGTRVRVANLTNGRTAEVRINDRGPFIDGRIIDLSRAAAREIELIGPGTARVRLTVLDYAEPPRGGGAYAVQVGAFMDLSRADRLSRELRRRYEPVKIVPREGEVTYWRVLVGRKGTPEEASVLAEQLRAATGAAFVVRLDGD